MAEDVARITRLPWSDKILRKFSVSSSTRIHFYSKRNIFPPFSNIHYLHVSFLNRLNLLVHMLRLLDGIVFIHLNTVTNRL